MNPGVAAGESVKYQVQLNSFEKSKENWQLDAGQKLEQVPIDYSLIRPEMIKVSYYVL